jgi:hypothetical protein
MAASDLSSITDVFSGASVVGSDLVIPIASIPSYSSGNDGKELCVGLLLAASDAIGGSDLTKLTSSTSQVAVDSDTLSKSFTFSAQLSYSFSDLNVEAEPTTTTTTAAP